MSTQKLNSDIYNKETLSDNNELLNLSSLLKLFLRNKIIISSFSIVFFIIGCLFSLSIKRTWEGQFQIVLESKNKSSGNPLLRNIGLGRENNSLLTQVEILKSPSVLMPVFEFYKANSDKSLDKEESFMDWQKNLNIELLRGTKVLNISYQDTNKSRIIPILDKTKLSYQEYSGRSKKRGQELKSNFLNDQIKIYKKKSSDALRELQEFGMNNNLDYQYSTPTTTNQNFQLGQNFSNNENVVQSKQSPNSQPVILPNVGIENIRIQASNRIRKIDLQLEKIKNLDDAGELGIYIGSTIPALVNEGFPENLRKIEEELVDFRTKYTDKDRAVIRLLEKRKLTKNFLKERAIKYLEAERLENEAIMESAIRPKEVLLKYKELLRIATRDESTLINLEDQLIMQKLEEAAIEDPWELITEPTLLTSPVAPSRKRIALLSSIIGLILGMTFSTYRENKLGKVFSKQEIKKLLPFQIISEINLNKIDFETQKLLFVRDYISNNCQGDLYFVYLEKIHSEDLEIFRKALIQQDFKKEIKLSSNNEFINKVKEEDRKYLIIKLGSANYQDLLILKQRQEFLDIKFDGIIILN